MTDLSSQAQAVLDTASTRWLDVDDDIPAQVAAAAIRAAADQVISPVSPPCADFDEYAQGFAAAHVKYRAELLAIAAELEGGAALAQPEPQGPTDEEGEERFQRWWFNEGSGMRPLNDEDQEEHARRVSRIAWHNGAYVTRWGRPAIEPVPVSERLPGPEECGHPEGECWWFDPASDGAWYIDTYQGNYTHWLPHWALPVPHQEAGQ